MREKATSLVSSALSNLKYFLVYIRCREKCHKLKLNLQNKLNFLYICVNVKLGKFLPHTHLAELFAVAPELLCSAL